MANVVIVFHSGYGHTRKLAEAVHEGAASAAGAQVTTLAIDAEGNLPDGGWEKLAAADAIIFGSPTYMGTVSWQFKKFADASSKPWFTQAWKDKIAAGFTNSASTNGDKYNTINYMFTLSMQHAMIWVGTGMMPANHAAAKREDDLNWIGAFTGAMSISPSDVGPDQAPRAGDLKTGRAFGKRVAEVAARWKKA
jgi:NAD(P)H dehydrogenase (quinone)